MQRAIDEFGTWMLLEEESVAYRFCSSPKKNIPVWCPFPLLMPPLVKAMPGQATH
jgi:hypothetical protein